MSNFLQSCIFSSVVRCNSTPSCFLSIKPSIPVIRYSTLQTASFFSNDCLRLSFLVQCQHFSSGPSGHLSGLPLSSGLCGQMIQSDKLITGSWYHLKGGSVTDLIDSDGSLQQLILNHILICSDTERFLSAVSYNFQLDHLKNRSSCVFALYISFSWNWIRRKINNFFIVFIEIILSSTKIYLHTIFSKIFAVQHLNEIWGQ